MPLGQGWSLVVAGVTCGGTHIGHSDAPRTRRQGRDGWAMLGAARPSEGLPGSCWFWSLGWEGRGWGGGCPRS